MTAAAETKEQEATPRELRVYACGGWLMGVGSAVTGVLWAVNLREPLPQEAYAVAVTISLVGFLTGVVFKAISTVAKWMTKLLDQEHGETRRQNGEATTRIEEAVAELRGQIAMVAGQVGRNGYLSNQLLAARTIDLVELRDQMEAVARDLTVNAIRDLEKSSASRYEALTDQVAELAAAVQSQGGHGNVVAMPNPQIYQLGIAEGERRAREGRDKPH